MEQTMQTVYIGTDALGLNLADLSDVDVLKTVSRVMPMGVMLKVSDMVAWVNAGVLLAGVNANIADDTIGFVAKACDLLRLAADVEKATEIGEPAIKRLMKEFIGGAKDRSESKKTNQIHSVRLGVASKVVLGDNVAPGEVHVRRSGNVAVKLHSAFVAMGILSEDSDPDAIEGQMVIVERHPVQVPYVAKIVLVNTLTKNLTLGNRMEFRAVNRGDADGDTLNMFPIPKKWALEFKAELENTLAMTGSVIDSALHVRGVSIAEDADTWAENPFKDGKTVEKKLSQEFVMSCDEWLAKHETMQGYANKYTPLAYRLSDIGAAMASLGDEAGRTAGLIGAIVEEDFYLGLTGGPAALDMAMEAWFSKPDSAKMRREVFSGLDTVLRPDLMTTPVRIAVMEAARINQGYFDPYDAKDVLVHYSFLIGKGMTTSGKPDGLVGIRSVYAGLMQLAQNKKLRGTNRFLVNIGLYAAERLAPVLEAKREDNDWSSDDEDELTL